MDKYLVRYLILQKKDIKNAKNQELSIQITVQQIPLNEPKVSVNGVVQSDNKPQEAINPSNTNGEKKLQEIMIEKKNNLIYIWGDNWQDNNHI